MTRPPSLRQKILIASVITLICGCAKHSAPPVPPEAARAVAELARMLTLVDFSLDRNEAGKSVLKGRVSNASDQAIAHASAKFRLLDENGNEVGTVVAGVDHLLARFSWDFIVEIPSENTASAKFVGFTTP